MSTTVTYKGSTLTTVENATKKLTTAGTWLEDDITIQDTSSGGGSVVVVDTPDSHGGTIREITAQNTVMLQGQKTVTLTTSPQTITPDTGYDGFASVVVDAGQIGMVTQDQDGYLVLSPNGDSGDTYDIFDLSKPVGELTTDQTNIKNIGYRTGITKVSAPDATKLSESAFRAWTNLEEVYLPMVYDINATYLFYNCQNLKGLVFNRQYDTAATQTQSYFATSCPKLQYLDCHFQKFQGTNSLANDTMLSILVLRKSNGICGLNGISVFNNTPFADGGTGGTLYVPNDLIATYQSATNWSTILGYTNNQIKSIESTHTDPTAPIDLTVYFADGTPIPTE